MRQGTYHRIHNSDFHRNTILTGAITPERKIPMLRKKHFLALLLAAALLTVTVLVPTAGAATYRQGSSGSVVTTIQTKLRRWGYYSGSVDGIYGSQTVKAVRQFQAKNGLSVDGVAGDATLVALGINASGSSATSTHSNGDVTLLAKVISAEARGEPYAGQVAVGAVILNRIRHPSFPSSVAGVVYEPGAFSCMDDGQINQPVADSAYRAARDAMNGSDPSGGAIYYFNPSTATSSWIWSRPLITIIGKHRFCS
jgi:N-acetylmuramoyl-L-alanine amidase